MRFLIIVFVLTIVTSLSSATKRSTCREPITFPNFNVTRYLGEWYQYSRNRHHFEEGCDCFNSELFAIDENTIRLINCCQMTSVSNEKQNCSIGVNKMTFINPETRESIFKYTKVGSQLERVLWVINSDYENYSIASGCDQVSEDEETEVFWIFSRHKEMSETLVTKINDILRSHNYDKKKLIKQQQGVELCKSKRPERRLLLAEP